MPPALIHDLDPEKIAANLAEVVAECGPGVEVLAATKYVPLEEMGALAEAGVKLVGENRQQDLGAKHERWGDVFEWDFIGNIQSRKVKLILPRVPADPLGRHRLRPGPARPPRRREHRGPDRGQRRRRGRARAGWLRMPSPSSSSAARSASVA